jgi:hypothetical protein
MIKWEKLKDIYYLSLFSYSRKRHILTCKVPELPACLILSAHKFESQHGFIGFLTSTASKLGVF